MSRDHGPGPGRHFGEARVLDHGQAAGQQFRPLRRGRRTDRQREVRRRPFLPASADNSTRRAAPHGRTAPSPSRSTSPAPGSSTAPVRRARAPAAPRDPRSRSRSPADWRAPPVRRPPASAETPAPAARHPGHRDPRHGSRPGATRHRGPVFTIFRIRSSCQACIASAHSPVIRPTARPPGSPAPPAPPSPTHPSAPAARSSRPARPGSARLVHAASLPGL